MGSLAATRFFAPVVLLSLLGLGCGATPPREDDIFHDPALRPGVEAANETDQQLLARMGEPLADAVVLGSQSYSVESPYHAASGRRCRAVTSGSTRRLACENPDASWVFVPDIAGAESAP